ncbi:MAG: ChaN family lipoprotein [Pseudomonadota bacterium]|nr:ChaN family lipoprotein [Pseudomonadota bacterium]
MTETRSTGRALGIWPMRSAVFVLATLLGACTTTSPPGTWDHRLRGDALVLLGEVHDNAQQHRLRLAALQRAFAAGWRPAIAMEQFDREHQDDIDRARRERPGDAQHVVDIAAPSASRAGSGWNWAFYRPFVELALRYDVPLIAANLSNTDAARIVRGGYSAVFGEATVAALGLGAPVAAELQSAQEREIDTGHCHALPPSMWPRMAQAQLARDAVMAEALRLGARGGGVVLLAGNGHVRHDIGVPRWLGAVKSRVFAVGYLEISDDSTPVTAFDAVVRTATAERADPCAEFERRPARNDPRLSPELAFDASYS